MGSPEDEVPPGFREAPASQETQDAKVPQDRRARRAWEGAPEDLGLKDPPVSLASEEWQVSQGPRGIKDSLYPAHQDAMVSLDGMESQEHEGPLDPRAPLVSQETVSAGFPVNQVTQETKDNREFPGLQDGMGSQDATARRVTVV